MRFLVLSAAAVAALIAAPALARSSQSAPPATQSSNGEAGSGQSAGKGSNGKGLMNSSLFGVGVAAAATLGIVLATRDSSPSVSP